MTTIQPLLPKMSSNELGFYKTCISICRGHYFEFGSGGSTVLAAQQARMASVTTVDSSAVWISHVLSQPNILKNKLKTIHVDINANDEQWGYPIDKSKINNWVLYSTAIKNDPRTYDLVLIDGRFRVACALNTLQSIHQNSIVLIHDYMDRPQYHIIEQFYDKITSVDTMVALKKKVKYDKTLLEKYILQYTYICE